MPKAEWWLLFIGNILSLAFTLYLWAATGYWLVAAAAVSGAAVIGALLWMRFRRAN